MNRYKVYCETDNRWEYSEGNEAPVGCPVDALHTIKEYSLVIDKLDIKKNYHIYNDVSSVIKLKNSHSINYKTELNSGVSYTPIFTIYDEGKYSGLLQKTEYYKDYIDDNDRGTLVLVVEEAYVLDESDLTLNHTEKPVQERVKTWKYATTDNVIDEIDVKNKPKKYNTRRKRHIEGIRRRENIIEQFIDNVGLAGILSGVFVDANDAYEKLTLLQEYHASAFSSWTSSGKGSLIDAVENDNTNLWLNSVVLDNPSTQAMCPWMIGLTFKAYTKDKLKGNIK